MWKIVKILLLIATLACQTFLGSNVASYAEDAAEIFSVGHTDFTPTRVDPKSERYGLLAGKIHLRSGSNFMPYLAAGLGYSLQKDDNLADPLKIRGGLGGQAGFRYMLGDNTSLHFDYKLLEMMPDAAMGQGIITSPHQSLGVGIEIKF